jgi:ABC-type dipeptide/oligopeptide/nickel transport system permease subunit
LKKDPLLFFGIGFLVLLLIFAFVGPLINHPYDVPKGKPFLPPGGEFWLGTDEQGRDIFARLAHGAQVSLLVGVVVQLVSLVLGTFVGILGVYAPSWISVPLMRFTDGMFAFPDILLAILIIGVWSSGLVPVIAALSVTAWPGIARLVRTQVATLKDREFVVASKAIGASPFFVVTRHVLPQLWGILLAVIMVDMAGTILAESTLSFLGIGITPPEPSWGNMIKAARENMRAQPMQLLWPCLILSTTIFALNFVGDGIRAIVDPKSRSSAPGGATLMSRLSARLSRVRKQQAEGAGS